MADIRNDFIGIKSPNPFWLASAPPTDKEYNVVRAFEAGWGGVVWKTLGEEGPPIVNVNGPRYGAIHAGDRRVIGFNNIELITDRPLEVNLREMKQVKRDWPDRAVIASIMVPCEEDAWAKILPLIEDTGVDGIELNLSARALAPRLAISPLPQVGIDYETVEQYAHRAKRRDKDRHQLCHSRLVAHGAGRPRIHYRVDQTRRQLRSQRQQQTNQN